MNPRFKKCLERKKILPFTKGERLINKELKTAQADLKDAKFCLHHGKYKWSTIQGYYSMYHSARAMIFSQGYRDRNHYCLSVALTALFIDQGILEI